IVADILDYRQLSKLCGTYGESLIKLTTDDGRIHTVLHQTGTATGRLSSSDPNMQNIPVREQIGRELRRYFTASAPDRILIDGDYSQIELRLLAELSGDERMSQAFIDGEDIHRRTASQVFGVPFDMVTPELRSRAKAVNFGIVYGIGAFSLSKDLHISRKMADEYIKNYLSTYSGVDSFLRNSVEFARQNGYTVTMFGRRRYIPEISSRNKNLQAFGERVAMNSPVQGSAADIIKLAMINVSSALEREGLDARLILQVHDELIIDSAAECADRAAEILKHEMENAAKTVVPLSVDVSMGYSWYDAK
ncbi:MAG: DNA polymerase I, partial [Clostridia bacterium]|nr:DNA polymerase I [Clostridia bacterium]